MYIISILHFNSDTDSVKGSDEIGRLLNFQFVGNSLDHVGILRADEVETEVRPRHRAGLYSVGDDNGFGLLHVSTPKIQRCWP